MRFPAQPWDNTSKRNPLNKQHLWSKRCPKPHPAIQPPSGAGGSCREAARGLSVSGRFPKPPARLTAQSGPSPPPGRAAPPGTSTTAGGAPGTSLGTSHRLRRAAASPRRPPFPQQPYTPRRRRGAGPRPQAHAPPPAGACAARPETAAGPGWRVPISGVACPDPRDGLPRSRGWLPQIPRDGFSTSQGSAGSWLSASPQDGGFPVESSLPWPGLARVQGGLAGSWHRPRAQLAGVARCDLLVVPI